MKKIAFVALAASLASSAMAGDKYIGGAVGRAAQNWSGSDTRICTTGAKLFGGVDLNDTFGAELGYTYFGSAQASYGVNHVSVKPKAAYAVLTVKTTFTQGLSAYAKFGAARTGTTGGLGPVGSANDTVTVKTHRATAMLGIGVSYSLNNNFSLFTEYEYYGKVIKDDGNYLKLNNLAAGVRYKF